MSIRDIIQFRMDGDQILMDSPQINSKVNPFLNGALYKRFYSGEVEFRFGYTHDYDFDSNGNKLGDSTNRSYILGRGEFRIDNDWLWGFTAERARRMTAVARDVEDADPRALLAITVTRSV